MSRRHRTRLQTPSLRFLTLQARRVERLDPMVRGLLWVAASGLLFVLLNAVLRGMSQQLHPMQAQFLRYLGAVLVMLPMVLRAGLTACWPDGLLAAPAGWAIFAWCPAHGRPVVVVCCVAEHSAG